MLARAHAIYLGKEDERWDDIRPDRDRQFRYLADQVRAHLDAGQPVVSVDAKKKELVGRYNESGSPPGGPRR